MYAAAITSGLLCGNRVIPDIGTPKINYIGDLEVQPKFKVGDKVRALVNHGWSTAGDTYTVAKCWYNPDLRECYVRLVEHLPKSTAHSHRANSYELIEPNTVLTPEEVFEHLRRGTKLEYEHEYKHNGYTVTEWKACANPQFANILNRVWRVKPEPEVIELNGKRYKLIEE